MMMMKIGGFLFIFFFVVAEFGIEVSGAPSGLNQCPDGPVRRENGKLIVPTETRACADPCVIYGCDGRTFYAGCYGNFDRSCDYKKPNNEVLQMNAQLEMFFVEAQFDRIGKVEAYKLFYISGCAGAKDPVTCMQKKSDEYGDLINKYDTSECKGESTIWELGARLGSVCGKEFDNRHKRNVSAGKKKLL